MTDTPTPAPAPAPNPAPAPTPTPPWYEGKLDAELLGHIEGKGWKKDDPIDVAINATKQARELAKHYGVPADQLLKLPSKADDEAGWKAVRERLGMPKEAKEYDLSTVKHADGKEIDGGLADALRAAMHKAGTPKDLAPEIVKAAVKHADSLKAAADTDRVTRIQTERADLQKEWGTNWEFNRLQAMQGARRAAGSEEGATKLVDAMQNSIGYKATMEFWRKIGAGTSEDTFVDNSHGGNPTTRNGAVARRAELMSDPDWTKRYLAGSSREVAEMNNLLTLIAGDAA